MPSTTFSEEDVDVALSGRMVTKVIYLPDAEFTITTQWVDGDQAAVSLTIGVPEPEALLQLAAGVAMLAMLHRRR